MTADNRRTVNASSGGSELEYYKKLVDELSAQVLVLEYRAWGSAERVSDLRKAFSLIAEIENDIGSMIEIPVLWQKLAAVITSRMRLDRTVILEPTEDMSRFRPVAWQGFPPIDDEELRSTVLPLPVSFLNERRSLLVNSKTAEDELMSSLRSFLGLPYFICTPVHSADRVISVLLVGRRHERLPDYPAFDSADIDTYEAIAGLLRTADLYHRELRRRVEVERERLRISSDMHDEIGASLTKIAIMSELALNASVSPEMKEQLERISATSREVIDSIGNIIWAINPKNDRLDNLVGYVREYAAGFLELTPIRCHIHFPEEVPDLSLTAESRRNLFLVIKESLNNIIKHSEASEVRMIMRSGDGILEFSIEDNGKGCIIDEDGSRGNGLKNMKNRMEAIGGTLCIKSRPGDGTNIILTVGTNG